MPGDASNNGASRNNALMVVTSQYKIMLLGSTDIDFANLASEPDPIKTCYFLWTSGKIIIDFKQSQYLRVYLRVTNDIAHYFAMSTCPHTCYIH